MTIRGLYLAAVVSLAWSPAANAATIVGSTYEFSTSVTGNTLISPDTSNEVPLIATDPDNPGFCVGPPLNCAGGSGLSGSFTFGNVSPGLDTITWNFSGSADDSAIPGSFTITLRFPGLEITDASVVGGGGSPLLLAAAPFPWLPIVGAAAVIGVGACAVSDCFEDDEGRRRTVVWNVTVTSAPAAAPEPSSLMLVGSALLGFGLMMWRRRHRAGRSWNVASSA